MDTKHLFDSDDDENDHAENQKSNKQRRYVTINRKFAREYQARKEEEELKQSRRRDEESDTEESSTDEDEGADLLTTELDVEILRTIHAVRSKDARIYDPQTRFFPTHSNDDDEENDDSDDDAAVRSKPKRYKDVVREQILEQMEREEENGEKDNDGDDEGVDARLDLAAKSRSHRLAYDSTQVGLRQAFLESAAQLENSEEEDDVILVKKTKSTRTNNADAERQLEVEIEKLRQTTTNKDAKHELVDHKGEVADGETFLLDFFKNRPWLERDESDDTDDDDDDNENVVMKGSNLAGVTLKSRQIDPDETSLEELDQADDFEAAFNFRFEQATEGSGVRSATGTLSGFEHSNISYARGNNSNQVLDPSLAMPTLRRPDDSRKLQRLARNERKAAERKAKEEELKRLKNAKRHEMNAKLRQIQAVMGQTEHSADAGETMDEAAIMKLLEGDFDPEQFESLMAATYNDEFYQQSDPEWTNDMAVRESLLKHKVVANEDGNGGEDADVLVGPDHVDGGLYDNHEDDIDFEHGTNYDQEEEEEWPEGDEDEEFNDNDDENDTEITKKVKAKINEELYKLDYEDIVAGIPTRFKYRQVTPNNYGLSTSEILCARDSTLKQFVSLKKLAPYAEQEHHADSRQRRRFREQLKKELEEENEKVKQEEATANNNEVKGEGDETEEPVDEKKKRRRRLKKGLLRKDEKNYTVKDDVSTHVTAGEVDLLPTSKDNNEEQLLKSIVPPSAKTVASDTDKEERGSAKRKRSKKKESNQSTTGSIGASTKQGDSKKALKRANKSKKPKMMEGVSVSRLASYGF